MGFLDQWIRVHRCSESSRLYGFDLDRQLHLLPKSHLATEAALKQAAASETQKSLRKAA